MSKSSLQDKPKLEKHPGSRPDSEGSALGWFSRLTNAERHAWFASFGGLGLDAMNQQAYALVLPSLILVMHLSTAQAGTFATAALVGGGLGGWAFGRLADIYGRIRMLQLTILLVAISTFLSAFATTFWQLLVARSFQGFGYGGEAAVGAVLTSEIIRPILRGRVTASVQSGYAIGYAIAVGFMALVFHVFSEAIAWRVLFALGILPIFFLIYIRRCVPESPLFEQAKRNAASHHAKANFGEIFSFAPANRGGNPACHLDLRRCLRADHLAADVSSHLAAPQRDDDSGIPDPQYSWLVHRSAAAGAHQR